MITDGIRSRCNRIHGWGYPWSCSEVDKGDQIVVDPEASQILRYFEYKHLPDNLQTISIPFCELALRMEETLPKGAEKSTALRKLLEAKDAAVRAALDI